jgi:hypothetical protein
MLEYIKRQLEKYDAHIDSAIREIERIQAEAQVLIKMLENLKSNKLDKRDGE